MIGHLRTLLTLLLVVCVTPPTSAGPPNLPPGHPPVRTKHPKGKPAQAGRFLQSLELALEVADFEARPVFVDFVADWCAPCKEMEASVFPDPEVQERLARFVRVRVDVETEAGKEAWNTYAISGLPTMILLGASGEEAKDLRIVGGKDKAELIAALDKAIATLKPPPTPTRERVARADPTDGLPGGAQKTTPEGGATWWIGAALGLLVAIGLVLWWTRRRKGGTARLSDE